MKIGSGPIRSKEDMTQRERNRAKIRKKSLMPKTIRDKERSKTLGRWIEDEESKGSE